MLKQETKKSKSFIHIRTKMGINKDSLLYMKKVYTLGDFFYWRVIGRFKGDKKETCLIRVRTKDEADRFMEDYS